MHVTLRGATFPHALKDKLIRLHSSKVNSLESGDFYKSSMKARDLSMRLLFAHLNVTSMAKIVHRVHLDRKKWPRITSVMKNLNTFLKIIYFTFLFPF